MHVVIRKLLRFALLHYALEKLLQFALKDYYILRGFLLHFSAIITFCGVTECTKSVMYEQSRNVVLIIKPIVF